MLSSALPPSAPTSVYGGSQAGGPDDAVFAFRNNTNSPSVTSNGRPMSNPPNDLVFHFAGPGTDDGYLSSGDQIGADYTGSNDLDDLAPPDVPDIPAPSSSIGMGSMLERGFMLQDRVDVPEPKRRKVESGVPTSSKGFVPSASNGLLAKGIKEERKKDTKPVLIHGTPVIDLDEPSGAAVKSEVKSEVKADSQGQVKAEAADVKPKIKPEVDNESKPPVTVDLTEGLCTVIFICK